MAANGKSPILWAQTSGEEKRENGASRMLGIIWWCRSCIYCFGILS